MAIHPLRLERLLALQSLELDVALRSQLGAVNGRLLSHHHLAVQHKTLRKIAMSVEHISFAVFSRPVVSAHPAAEQLAKDGIPSIRGPVLAFLAPGPHFINFGDGTVNPHGTVTGIVCGPKADTSVRLVGMTGRARVLLSRQEDLVELIAFVAQHDATEREVNDHVDCEPQSFHPAVHIGGGRPQQSRSVLQRHRAPWHALRTPDADYDALARFS
jgi:hypothetical protein